MPLTAAQKQIVTMYLMRAADPADLIERVYTLGDAGIDGTLAARIRQFAGVLKAERQAQRDAKAGTLATDDAEIAFLEAND